MDIFEFCMKMEKDGEKFYRDMAFSCKLPGLKKILSMLADDEVEHYKFFKSLKENSSLDYINSTIIPDTKNIFQEMQETEKEFNLEGTNAELFREAMEVEKKSEAFYKEKAEELDSDNAKKIFLKIAAEEAKHAHLLNNVIEFIGRPETWIENAEFHHLDEY